MPQQPVLFSGRLRYNLDPCHQYSDEECWTALDFVQLKKMAVDHSAGLLLPVDGEMEAAVQEMLLERIRDRTVLTIAHRLKMVMRNDRMFYLNKFDIDRKRSV